MFFTLISGDNYFSFLYLANCVRHESCREKIALISSNGLKYVVQTVFGYIDGDFAIN